MNWQIWIENNYAFLRLWSRRWAGQNWGELLSCYTGYLEKNWARKMVRMNDEERLKFSQTWMKNMTKWSNSEFNREIRVNNFEEEFAVEDEIECHIELKAEATSDISEWLIDIHTEFGDELAYKLIRLRKVYLQLETHEKVLYDLYFTNMLSLREIGKKLSLPHSAVYQMINVLKEKIISLV